MSGVTLKGTKMREKIIDLLGEINLMPWSESSGRIDELLRIMQDPDVPNSWRSLAKQLSTNAASLKSAPSSDLPRAFNAFSETFRELHRVVSENRKTVGDFIDAIRKESENLRDEIKFLTMERDAAQAESKQFEDALKRVLDAASKRDASAEYGVVEEFSQDDRSDYVTAVAVRLPVGTRVMTQRIE